MLFSHAVRVLCKVVSVLVLARLVTPPDHGLYAMAASLTLLLTVFRDFGLGTAAVQAPQLDEDERTTLCWAHVAMGCVLSGATLALIPAVIWFYEKPELGPLVALMSTSFVFLGINAFPRVLLARELRFATLNRLETIAVLLATAVLIVTGAAGGGAYAFAAFLLTFEGSLMIAAWRACSWRPRGRRDLSRLRPLLRTGASLTGYNLVVHVCAHIDTVAVGKWFGPTALGLYSRSAQLLLLPIQNIATPLGQVLLAALPRTNRVSSDFRDQLFSTISIILYLTMPVAVLCIVLPNETTRIVLGSDWLEAAPFLRWLAVGVIFTAMSSTVHPLAVALGRTGRLVTLSLVSLLTVCAALALARGSGALAIAKNLAVANALLLFPRLWWITRGSSVHLDDYMSAFTGPVIFSAALAAGLGTGSALASSAAWPARLAVSLAGGGLCIALICLSAPRLRRELNHVWSHRPRFNALQRSATKDSP